MAANEETSRDDEREIDEGLLHKVSDAALSHLAPRLGKDWRAFMRGELWINQWNIEEIGSEPHLPVAERIYRLLRLWKTTSKEEPTTSCLVRHLKSFGYSIDTWEVLTKYSDFKSTTEVHYSQGAGRPAPCYNQAHVGINIPFVPQFCYVIEVTDDVNTHGCQGILFYPKGTKLDVVDVTQSHLLLARDIEGNLVRIPREVSRQIKFHTPILWENGWFHEEVIRTQLETIFSPYEKGSFLIREASENGFFAISVKDTYCVKHFKIECTEKDYIIAGDRHFYSLTDLISFFKGTWINTSTDGRLFLRDYVPKNQAVNLKLSMDVAETQA